VHRHGLQNHGSRQSCRVARIDVARSCCHEVHQNGFLIDMQRGG